MTEVTKTCKGCGGRQTITRTLFPFVIQCGDWNRTTWLCGKCAMLVCGGVDTWLDNQQKRLQRDAKLIAEIRFHPLPEKDKEDDDANKC